MKEFEKIDKIEKEQLSDTQIKPQKLVVKIPNKYTPEKNS